MTRRIFVGDLQGCRQELEDLLETLRFDPADDRLHSVGDVVNRGPDSAGCIRLLRELGAVVVVGNHELHALAVQQGRRRIKERDTLDSLMRADDRDELLGWLLAGPVLHVEEDLVLVHAGLHPTWRDLEHTAADLAADLAVLRATGIASSALRFAVSVRFCDPLGRLPEHWTPPPAAPFAPWDTFYEGGRTVVFGHWADRGLAVEGRVRGLDSGCVYGGPLSAWIAEEDRVVQVPARKVWCRW